MNQSHPLLKFLVFTLVAALFAAWLVTTIGNIHPFRAAKGYTAEFTDVSGLLVNDAVKVSGVTVGKVTGMQVQPGGTAKVHFSVRKDVDVGTRSQIEVRWRGVLGLRFLYVVPAGSTPAEPGYDFPNTQTRSPTDIGLLLERLTPVMRGLDPKETNQVVQAFAQALKGREQQVRDLISQGASLTQAVASRDQQIRDLLTNAATLVNAYAKRQQQIRDLIDSFSQVATTVAKRNDTLVNAVSSIADVQGQLHRLLQANDKNLRESLDQLETISTVLENNHQNLEDLVTYSGTGIVAYHSFSRWGQFFNIRAPGMSVAGNTVTSERGGHLPSNTSSSSSNANASLAPFFGQAAAGQGVR